MFAASRNIEQTRETDDCLHRRKQFVTQLREPVRKIHVRKKEKYFCICIFFFNNLSFKIILNLHFKKQSLNKR